MGTKLERITEISATTKKPEFTSLYHLINFDMLIECHNELDGKKAVGIDRMTKAEYETNLWSIRFTNIGFFVWIDNLENRIL